MAKKNKKSKKEKSTKVEISVDKVLKKMPEDEAKPPYLLIALFEDGFTMIPMNETGEPDWCDCCVAETLRNVADQLERDAEGDDEDDEHEHGDEA